MPCWCAAAAWPTGPCSSGCAPWSPRRAASPPSRSGSIPRPSRRAPSPGWRRAASTACPATCRARRGPAASGCWAPSTTLAPSRIRVRAPDGTDANGAPKRPVVPAPRAGSGGERRSAAAGGRGVRVPDDELGALEVFLVVDLGAHQILVAHGVDEQRDATLFHAGVVLVHFLVES